MLQSIIINDSIFKPENENDEPCGHKSHKLLHTHYIERGKKLV
ncbi:iron hydrogenase small subunit [bacterium]|nr:iron hydrogenase small subunit [bacterium]MBU1065771.1 iron hydrogenase small subunit [bacterium]MBU1633356.1 iron hydrogenase small subunit [bacterium]MBU1875057.1 iron hydrogenase small subunit [bacterium]